MASNKRMYNCLKKYQNFNCPLPPKIYVNYGAGYFLNVSNPELVNKRIVA